MVNSLDIIRANPTSRMFELGELVVAQFECPVTKEALGVWSRTDHLVHVLIGTSTWETSVGVVSVAAGETIFFKKGAFILPPHSETRLCLVIAFIPDAIVRETVRELAGDLPASSGQFDMHTPHIAVTTDIALTTFFHTMVHYVVGNAEMPGALVKLKIKELCTGILLGHGNEHLAAYFRALNASEAPSIPEIMEANFRHNLELEAFARMCHRSLSTFKREFQKHYGMSPGKWLLDRRLVCSANLLRTTSLNVTEIAFRCGFEEAAHFSRAFKAKFGHSPSEHRELAVALA
jgi:AraC family transcriptional regulator, exoenzyme S synthesis regulatory protein ExsA